MAPIDPRLVRAKRFPVHAAVDRCNEAEVRRLVDADADFHLGRKIPPFELSVVHTACTARLGPADVVQQILEYLVQKHSPLHDVDSVGQTPLHYAVCNAYAARLVPILVEAGAKLDVQRNPDRWTPLHLAVAFNQPEVVHALLMAEADVHLKDDQGRMPLDLAKIYGNVQLADMLRSPIKQHRPTSRNYPSLFDDVLKKVKTEWNSSMPLPTPVKFKEEQLAWRDDQGNSLLHLAAWVGDLKVARAFFENVKGRKLVQVDNKKGATPLAMAIIAGQSAMVEEFFMNKHSKKFLNFQASLNNSKQNIAHLMFQFVPNVHPKFILKRKDITKEMLNSLDKDGYSPLLICAQNNNKAMVGKILASKNVKDNKLLDLGMKSLNGKNILHYLVENCDTKSFRSILDREELTPEIANAPNEDKENILNMCLRLNRMGMIKMIFQHPTARTLFKFLEPYHGKTLLHICAEKADLDLWECLLAHPDVDTNIQDEQGNTAIMQAAIGGHAKLVEICCNHKEVSNKIDLNKMNVDGNSLLLLCIQHMGEAIVMQMVNALDVKGIINIVNKEGQSALLLAASLGKWEVVQALLENDRLKNDKGESVIDVHLANKAGSSCLVLLLLARIKLARVEQTQRTKKELELAAKTKEKQDFLSSLISLVLCREKEHHGPTMVQGRDAGSNCIKKQMSGNMIIRTPVPEEVVSEFKRLYLVLKTKKKSSGTPQNLSRQESLKDSETSNGTLPASPNDPQNAIPIGPSMLKKSISRQGSKDIGQSEEEPVNVELHKENECKPNKNSARKNSNKDDAIPMLTLEDLRSPEAMENAIAMMSEKIAKEKKKVVKKQKKISVTTDKASLVGEKENEPKPQCDVVKVSKENESKVSDAQLQPEKYNDSGNGILDIGSSDYKLTSNGNTDVIDTGNVHNESVKNVKNGKEWSPVPTPRIRRMGSDRKHSGDKPPRPSGPSPPPPDDEDAEKKRLEIIQSQGKCQSPTEEPNQKLTSDAPKRNETQPFNEVQKTEFTGAQEHSKNESETDLTEKSPGEKRANKVSDKDSCKTGVNWSQLKPTSSLEKNGKQKQEDILISTENTIQENTENKSSPVNKNMSIGTIPTSESFNKADASTQTDSVNPAGSGTKQCCCSCHFNSN